MGNDTKLMNALIKFQAEVPIIEKSKKGHNYKYAPYEKIIKVITPILTKNSLGYTHKVFSGDNHVGVETILFHSESGESYSTVISCNISENKSRMSQVQTMGSIITYLKRYSLSGLLGIATDEDIDGSEPKPEPKPEPNNQFLNTNKTRQYALSLGVTMESLKDEINKRMKGQPNWKDIISIDYLPNDPKWEQFCYRIINEMSAKIEPEL
jgi:hypothetical protein